jgi:hypothetical protein
MNAAGKVRTDEPLWLPLQVVGTVYFGVLTEIIGNFLGCLSHMYHAQSLDLSLDSLPLLVAVVIGSICFLGYLLFVQEKKFEFRKHPVLFTTAFAAAFIIAGYFYPSHCPPV